MSRRPRIHADNAFYHATLRGNHRQPVFLAEADRRLLNAIVDRSLQKYEARIHAYCWMSNHLHFLVQVGGTPLGELMRQIASGYARALQQELETTGHLFERRYFARMVTSNSYLLQLLRYIHLNPVQANLVRNATEYPWSSHCAYAGGRAESWLTTDFALALFAADRATAHAAYRQFVDDGDPDWTPDDGEGESKEQPAVAIPTNSSRPVRIQIGKPRQTLEELMTEACGRFNVDMSAVISRSREKALVLARAWIGREAVHRGIAGWDFGWKSVV